MSVSYRTRKKAIKRANQRLERVDALDPKGHIPENVFRQMQADWSRKITGPPIGALADLMEARR